MGYLDAFPTASPPPFTSSGSTIGHSVPLRTERLHCWAARDAFFACLDRNGIVDAVNDTQGVQEAARRCGREDQVLHRDCAHSWVKYFKERRVYEQRKKEQLKQLEKEGAQKLDATLPGVPSAPAPTAAAQQGGKA